MAIIRATLQPTKWPGQDYCKDININVKRTCRNITLVVLGLLFGYGLYFYKGKDIKDPLFLMVGLISIKYMLKGLSAITDCYYWSRENRNRINYDGQESWV